MEPLNSLLAQGGFGITAAIMLWLYIGERKDHKETLKLVTELQEARRLDAVETRTDVTQVLQGISQNLESINTKIVVSKDRQR